MTTTEMIKALTVTTNTQTNQIQWPDYSNTAPKAAWNKTKIPTPTLNEHQSTNNNDKTRKQKHQTEPLTSTEALIMTTNKDKSINGNHKLIHKQETKMIDR